MTDNCRPNNHRTYPRRRTPAFTLHGIKASWCVEGVTPAAAWVGQAEGLGGGEVGDGPGPGPEPPAHDPTPQRLRRPSRCRIVQVCGRAGWSPRRFRPGLLRAPARDSDGRPGCQLGRGPGRFSARHPNRRVDRGSRGPLLPEITPSRGLRRLFGPGRFRASRPAGSRGPPLGPCPPCILSRAGPTPSHHDPPSQSHIPGPP
jgi:hypothetical protein